MIVNNGREKVVVFTRYFDTLYNPPVKSVRTMLGEFEAQAQGEMDKLSISEVERKRVVKAMHNRKAAKICRIPYELLKYG